MQQVWKFVNELSVWVLGFTLAQLGKSQARSLSGLGLGRGGGGYFFLPLSKDALQGAEFGASLSSLLADGAKAGFLLLPTSECGLRFGA